MSLRIGVLLPGSVMFPGVDRAFIGGLRGALGEGGLAQHLAIEPVGACAVKDHVTDKVQRLLLMEQPHVVTGIMGAALSNYVHHHFRDHRVPFIANNLGGDVLSTGGEENPFVFWNSLNVWRSCYALGYWAANNVGKRAALAVGFHESGYGIVRAFWAGFEDAGGGVVLATEVTHPQSSDQDPSEQLSRLAALDPDFVFALYSGRSGISFMKSWTHLGLTRRIPLVSTPLMFHGNWLPEMSSEALGVRSACSWIPGSWPEADARFIASVPPGRQSQPNVFGLLGYETGTMLCAAVSAVGTTDPPEDEFRDALDGIRYGSPRGEMHLDPELGSVGAEDHLYEVREMAPGDVRWSASGPIGVPEDFSAEYREHRARPVKSGWLNPYLIN